MATNINSAAKCRCFLHSWIKSRKSCPPPTDTLITIYHWWRELKLKIEQNQRERYRIDRRILESENWSSSLRKKQFHNGRLNLSKHGQTSKKNSNSSNWRSETNSVRLSKSDLTWILEKENYLKEKNNLVFGKQTWTSRCIICLAAS